MELVKCALCLCKCSPGFKITENELKSKGTHNHSQADINDPVKNQLQIILLLRKILEVPQEVCCKFLRDYGDPCSWINCCHSCSTLVGKFRVIFDQIIVLQKQFEHLQKEIRDIIIESTNSDDDTKYEFQWGVGVQGEIRSFITKGFCYPVKEEFFEDIFCSNKEATAISNTDLLDSITKANERDSEKNEAFELHEEDDSYYDGDNNNQDGKQDKKLPTDKFKKRHRRSKTKRFSKINEVSDPLKIHPEDNPLNSKMTLCEFCGKCFKNGRNLIEHKRRHAEGRPYECKICGKRFRVNNDLKKHKRTHTGENTYNCKHCEKKFTHSYFLELHEKSHSRGKIQCKVCEKIFTRTNHLKDHARIHTGDKPYKCKFCEKHFIHTGDLKRHERTHTGEKPYKCKSCDKGFAQSFSLRIHEKIHLKAKARETL